MTLRIATGRERAALLVSALVCFVFLSFFSIRAAFADYLSGQDIQSGYQRAARLEPANAAYLYALGRYWQYNLENPDPPLALSAYRASLVLDPLSADTWLDLATLLESEGNVAEARSAYAQAERVYPISAEVAWRYGNFLLRQNDLKSAFAKFRRSLEVDPSRGAEAFSRCIRVEPDVQTILDAAIPPSRPVYLDILRGLSSAGQMDDALLVWRRLPPSQIPIRLQEIAALVESLRRQKRQAEAVGIWRQAAQLSGLGNLDPPNSLLWDGGFESGVTNFGFAWNYPALSQGVQIVRDSSEKRSGNYSLRLSFDGKYDLAFRNVCHVVPVQPGASYLLTAWTRTRGITTDEGVRIELRAAPPAAPAAAMSSAPLGTKAWSRTELTWDSPPNAFEASVCLLRNASIAEDSRIQGIYWIDDVALRRVDPSRPAANP